MQLIPGTSTKVKSYINLNLKFHDYSSIYTAFDVEPTATLGGQ